jgi:hypothetical protein
MGVGQLDTDRIMSPRQWDVRSVSIEPLKFSTWGVSAELMSHFIPYAKNAGITLQTDEKDKITFNDLKTIVHFLHEKGFNTADLNTAIKDAIASRTTHMHMTREEFKEIVESLYKQTPIQVHDDLQKNRWGGKSLVNNYEVTARVKKSVLPGYYNVEAVARSVDAARPLKGWVAFFLHDTFPNEIEYVQVKDNAATFTMKHCYEAFTLAVYLEDGTILELDLNEEHGFPEGFYWKDLTSFQSIVKAMYNQTPVVIKDDLQKGRWGGQSEKNDKTLKASVEPSWIPGYFTVYFQITCKYPEKFTGEAAFFLHDSFGREIRFVGIKDGFAELKIKAYEAFTVGAYTQDGTSLELDLNEVDGFPEGFYYMKNQR